MEETKEASLTVYDASGRILFTRTNEFAKGYNQISVNSADLNATGLLFYRLSTDTDSATKRMIILNQ